MTDLSKRWETSIAGKSAMAIIGVAIAAMALIALAKPGAYIDEGMTAAGGVIAFSAPWLFSYTEPFPSPLLEPGYQTGGMMLTQI